MTPPQRQRLPNRRPAETHRIEAGGIACDATIGIDPTTGRTAELFLDGPKAGSAMAALAHDVAVIVSIALQSGLSSADLAQSVARVPDAFNQPASRPASIVGAALDLITACATEKERMLADVVL